MIASRELVRSQLPELNPAGDGLRLSRAGLDRHNPVVPEVERQLFVEPIDERRTVLVEERDEPDRSFLCVTVGKGERARVR